MNPIMFYIFFCVQLLSILCKIIQTVRNRPFTCSFISLLFRIPLETPRGQYIFSFRVPWLYTSIDAFSSTRNIPYLSRFSLIITSFMKYFWMIFKKKKVVESKQSLSEQNFGMLPSESGGINHLSSEVLMCHVKMQMMAEVTPMNYDVCPLM